MATSGDKKILVTGGTGYIGAHTVVLLVQVREGLLTGRKFSNAHAILRTM